MRKTILLLSVLFLALTCGSDRADSAQGAQIAQDFTNADFIKTTMLGTWKMSHTNYNGTWSQVNDPMYESTYKFNVDNSYTYKPYTQLNNTSLNQLGSYSITAATTTVNAKLNFTYTLNNQPRTSTVILENYNNGIVEIAETSILCPSGTCRERFQKQ